MYERLVVGKHRLHRIHCSVQRVQELFLKRWREDSWDEDENRDDQEFLELEKEIYLKEMPHNAELFEGEEEAEKEEQKQKDKKKKAAKKKEGKKKQSAMADAEVVIDDDSESNGDGSC